jgi:glycosyltransferase involved in cell wall biosynthesis
MACGTPVLTYRKQGPSETVIDGKTGWLAGTDTELVKMAVDTWKSDYDSRMRRNCRERALAFDIKRIYRQWTEILSLK